MDQKRDPYLIPASIVVAGLLVAGAVLYSSGAGGVKNQASEKNSAPVPDANPSSPANAKDIKPVSADYVLGNPEAKVAVIEYGDFQCPFCGRFFKTTEGQLKESYVKGGKALFIWRDFAFLGEESFRAAEAARCAGEEGKFWEYHDYLFNHQNGENQGAFSDANLKSFAAVLKLDAAKFASCLDSGKYRKAVEASSEKGKSFGVSGTPTTFVNGREISGAVPFSEIQNVIEDELKK